MLLSPILSRSLLIELLYWLLQGSIVITKSCLLIKQSVRLSIVIKLRGLLNEQLFRIPPSSAITIFY
jgi:hypothetical protein